MATIVHLVPFLLIACAGLTWAQDGPEEPETTTHINPHLPITIPISDDTEDQTTYSSDLYRGRPKSTIQFGGPRRRRIRPDDQTNTADDSTNNPTTDNSLPQTSVSPPIGEQPRPNPQPTSGWRWVYSGGRWRRVRPNYDRTTDGDGTEGTGTEGIGNGGTGTGTGGTGTEGTGTEGTGTEGTGTEGNGTNGTGGTGGGYNGDASGAGHQTYGHQIVHIDSSETNNWNHAIHHESKSGQIQKKYSKTSYKSGHFLPAEPSTVPGSGQSHASSGSGESVSSGSGENSASGSGSE